LPSADKPIQLLTTGKSVRSLHGVAYTRLWNADLLEIVDEFATDFRPPPKGTGGATGLYCGEQDMFAFLIDPTGWAEINGEAFAPGFFVWNSEVGRRSLGIQTFWFEAVCQNHIVWDAVEVAEFTRKHTANVHDGLSEIRRIIETLVEKREARRDRFVRVLTKAMQETLGADAEAVAKQLAKNGIARNLARDAIEIAREQGGFTIFSLVDALTRLTQRAKYVGDRVEADTKVAGLLALAA
jgi:predicted GNAT family acetyltransferase